MSFPVKVNVVIKRIDLSFHKSRHHTNDLAYFPSRYTVRYHPTLRGLPSVSPTPFYSTTSSNHRMVSYTHTLSFLEQSSWFSSFLSQDTTNHYLCLSFDARRPISARAFKICSIIVCPLMRFRKAPSMHYLPANLSHSSLVLSSLPPKLVLFQAHEWTISMSAEYSMRTRGTHHQRCHNSTTKLYGQR